MTLYRDEPGGPYDRKVVVGTELIESSITINGAIFVIDNGYSLDSGYNPDRMEDYLKPDRVSKAAAIQRKGRVGRVAPGECYKLYTEEEYENLEPNPVLAIRKERTEPLLLEIFKKPDIQDLGDVLDYVQEFIEPPPENLLKSGIKTLAGMKIISGEKEQDIITERGQKVALALRAISGDVQMASMLVSSFDYHCDYEIAALIAILSYRDISVKRLMRPPIKGDKRDGEKHKAKKKSFTHEIGDIFTMLKMYMTYYQRVKKMTRNVLMEYCYDNYLDYKVLSSIRREHLKIWRESRFLEDYRNPDVRRFDRFTNMLFSIIHGYYINIAKKMKGPKGKTSYKNWFPKIKTLAGIGRESVLGKKEDYIYYISLRNTPAGKNFEICNKISKKQIDIANKLFDFGITFDRRTTRRLVPLKPLVPRRTTRKGKKGTKNIARNKIKSEMSKIENKRTNKRGKRSRKEKRSRKSKK